MTPLEPIALELVRLSERRALTPVLVTPSYLELRPVFLVELARALVAKTERAIRIDWCRQVPSVWSLIADQTARYRAKSFNRALQQVAADHIDRVSLQITASIARPGGTDRKLVIGWCSEAFELPTWTVPVFLSGSQTHDSGTQASRSDAA
jgi:hypothetical protein